MGSKKIRSNRDGGSNKTKTNGKVKDNAHKAKGPKDKRPEWKVVTTVAAAFVEERVNDLVADLTARDPKKWSSWMSRSAPMRARSTESKSFKPPRAVREAMADDPNFDYLEVWADKVAIDDLEVYAVLRRQRLLNNSSENTLVLSVFSEGGEILGQGIVENVSGRPRIETWLRAVSSEDSKRNADEYSSPKPPPAVPAERYTAPEPIRATPVHEVVEKTTDETALAQARDAARLKAEYLLADSSKACFVPDPSSVSGFRVLELQEAYLSSGFGSTQGRAAPSVPPSEALLDALADLPIDRPAIFVPQAYSRSNNGNVRFAAVVPTGFANRGEVLPPVVHLEVGMLTSGRLASEIRNPLFLDSVRAQLEALGYPDAVALLLEPSPGSAYRRLDGQSVRQAIEDAALPWVAQHLGTQPELTATGEYHPVAALPPERAPKEPAAPPTQVEDPKSPEPEPTRSPKAGEAARVREQLDSIGRWGWGVLVPTPSSETLAFRPLVLSVGQHGGGLASGYGGSSRLPDLELLRELGKRNQRTMLLPQLRSEILGHNIRFAALLPPGFDPERETPYDVIHAADPLERSTIAGAWNEGLLRKLEERLESEGIPDAIVLIPERYAGDRGYWSNRTDDALEDVFDNELHAYAREHLNGDEGALARWSLRDAPTQTPKPTTPAPSAPDRTAEMAAEVRAWLDRSRSPAVLVPTSNEQALSFRPIELATHHQKGFISGTGPTSRPPNPVLLHELGKRSQRTVLVPSLASETFGHNIRFAAIVPPGFDPDREQPYDVIHALLPTGIGTLGQAINAGLFRGLDERLKEEGIPDAVVLVPELRASDRVDRSPEALQRVLEQELHAYAREYLNGDEEAIDQWTLGETPSRSTPQPPPTAIAPAPEKSKSDIAYRLQALRGILDHRQTDLPGLLVPDFFEAPALSFRASDYGGQNWLGVRGRPGVPSARPPEPELLTMLGERNVPHVLLTRIHSEHLGHIVNFAAVLPKGFDPQRETPYDLVEVVVDPVDANVAKAIANGLFTELQEALEKNGIPDAILLIPERATADYGPWKDTSDKQLDAVLAELCAYAAEHLNADAAPVDSWIIDAPKTQPTAPPPSKDRDWLRPGDSKGWKSDPTFGYWAWSWNVPYINGSALRLKDVDVPGSAAADLQAIAEKVKGSEPLLAALVEKRPDLFDGKDSVTGKAFSHQLRQFVEDGQLRDEGEEKGLLNFLSRLDDKAFRFRRSGYSHAGGIVMLTMFTHPGLVLDLIEAARAKRPYPLKKLYEGDGPDALPPLDSIAQGFATVGNDHPMIEYALMRAVRETLQPQRLTEDRVARTCDRIAVALSKLTGQDIRYGWAYNLKSGEDLVAAMASQDTGAITMGDVSVYTPSRGELKFHFPTFHDYDPKTQTVAVSDFGSPPQRISVEGMDFAFNPRRRPSIYYIASEQIDPFLTLEEQRRYAAELKGAPPKDPSWGEKHSGGKGSSESRRARRKRGKGSQKDAAPPAHRNQDKQSPKGEPPPARPSGDWRDDSKGYL